MPKYTEEEQKKLQATYEKGIDFLDPEEYFGHFEYNYTTFNKYCNRAGIPSKDKKCLQSTLLSFMMGRHKLSLEQIILMSPDEKKKIGGQLANWMNYGRANLMDKTEIIDGNLSHSFGQFLHNSIRTITADKNLTFPKNADDIKKDKFFFYCDVAESLNNHLKNTDLTFHNFSIKPDDDHLKNFNELRYVMQKGVFNNINFQNQFYSGLLDDNMDDLQSFRGNIYQEYNLLRSMSTWSKYVKNMDQANEQQKETLKKVATDGILSHIGGRTLMSAMERPYYCDYYLFDEQMAPEPKTMGDTLKKAYKDHCNYIQMTFDLLRRFGNSKAASCPVNDPKFANGFDPTQLSPNELDRVEKAFFDTFQLALLKDMTFISGNSTIVMFYDHFKIDGQTPAELALKHFNKPEDKLDKKEKRLLNQYAMAYVVHAYVTKENVLTYTPYPPKFILPNKNRYVIPNPGVIEELPTVTFQIDQEVSYRKVGNEIFTEKSGMYTKKLVNNVPVPPMDPTADLEKELRANEQPKANEKKQEAEIKTEPVVEKKAEAEIKPEPVVEKKAEAEIKPEPVVEKKAEAEIKPEPVVEKKPEVKPQPEPVATEQNNAPAKEEPKVEDKKQEDEVKLEPVATEQNNAPAKEDPKVEDKKPEVKPQPEPAEEKKSEAEIKPQPTEEQKAEDEVKPEPVAVEQPEVKSQDEPVVEEQNNAPAKEKPKVEDKKQEDEVKPEPAEEKKIENEVKPEPVEEKKPEDTFEYNPYVNMPIEEKIKQVEHNSNLYLHWRADFKTLLRKTIQSMDASLSKFQNKDMTDLAGQEYTDLYDSLVKTSNDLQTLTFDKLQEHILDLKKKSEEYINAKNKPDYHSIKESGLETATNLASDLEKHLVAFGIIRTKMQSTDLKDKNGQFVRDQTVASSYHKLVQNIKTEYGYSKALAVKEDIQQDLGNIRSRSKDLMDFFRVIEEKTGRTVDIEALAKGPDHYLKPIKNADVSDKAGEFVIKDYLTMAFNSDMLKNREGIKNLSNEFSDNYKKEAKLIEMEDGFKDASEKYPDKIYTAWKSLGSVDTQLNRVKLKQELRDELFLSRDKIQQEIDKLENWKNSLLEKTGTFKQLLDRLDSMQKEGENNPSYTRMYDAIFTCSQLDGNSSPENIREAIVEAKDACKAYKSAHGFRGWRHELGKMRIDVSMEGATLASEELNKVNDFINKHNTISEQAFEVMIEQKQNAMKPLENKNEAIKVNIEYLMKKENMNTKPKNQKHTNHDPGKNNAPAVTGPKK